MAPNTLQLKNKITIEIDGESKPGCVAEFLTRVIYAWRYCSKKRGMSSAKLQGLCRASS